MTERRTIIAVGLSILGFMMLCYIWPLMFSTLYGGGGISAASCASIPITFVVVLCVIATSLSMRPYFQRSSSSAALMLPATNGEKFAAIFVRTFIVNIVAIFALGIVIELLWSLALGQTMDWSVWFGPDLFENLGSWAIAHAIFMFGATIFRRNALIFTFLCFLAIMFVVSSVGAFFLVGFKIQSLDFGYLNRLFWVIKFALAVGLWIWSYIRFTKIQITK